MHAAGDPDTASDHSEEAAMILGDLDVVLIDHEHEVALRTMLPSRKQRDVTDETDLWRRSNSLHPRHLGSTLRRRLSTASRASIKSYREEENEIIRAMPVPMQRKREMRHRMRDRVDGGKSWQRRQKKCWGSFKLNLTQFLYSLELFKGSLKSVEGEHGTGVGSYFRFVRSLMILNIFLTLIIITIILIPQVAMKPRDYNTTLPEYNTSQYHKTHEAASTCSATYQKFLTDDVIGKRTNVEYVLDVLQGTGILEDTVLFYGQYFNRTWNEPGGKQHSYNMGMAYLCCIGAFFLLSLAVIVYFTGQGVREAMVSSEKHFNRYFNLTFSGWDYVLSKAKPVTRRQINIFREFKVGLEEQSRKRLRLEMSTAKRCRLYTIRVVINLIVLVVLGGALALIGYVTDLSGKLMKEGETYNSFVVLLIEFMPSITIAAINLILPKFFLFIVQYEGYMSETEVKWTLIRSVVLRLSSLGALIYILRNQLYQSCGEESSFGLASSRGSNNTDVQCGNCIWGITKCWESYIGQQIYKLVIFDFFIVVFKTFLYEFPRRALVQKYPKFFLFKLFGLQEFELPLQVLDIVYTQTLCWFGAYFSPLIPAITTMKCLIFFFVKKVTVLHNMVPSSRPYQASQSNYFFMIVLLLAYVLAVIPVGHVIGNFHPSQTCGPFRVYLTSSEPFHAFDMVYAFIATLPSEIQPVIQAIGATYVIVPVIIVLCLVITYYFSMASALNRTAELLKNQLALEGIDKQHLLIRIREVMHGAKVHQA